MAFVRSKQHPVSRKYRGGFTDWTGKQVLFTGTTNSKETLRMAQNFEDKHRKIRLGDLPPPKISDKPREFSDMVKEYLTWGISQGGHGGRPWSATHVATRTRHLTKFWPRNLKLTLLQDVTLPKIEAVARNLMAGKIEPLLVPGRKVKAPEPATGKTVQSHVESIKSLCIWAKERGYLETNPLEGMAGFDTTPRETRRAMTVEEIVKLLDVAPPERRLVYEVAMCTGYRKGELAALTVGGLNLEMCSLSLAAEFCKSRKASRQPIPAVLAEKLRATSEGKPHNAPMLTVSTHIDRYFYNDLMAANILETAPGGKLVFHSLRHTYCTLVIDAGATLTEAQRLLRHQDPTMTANTYSHARQDRLQTTAEAVGVKVMAPNSTALIRHRLAAGAEGDVVSALLVEDCVNDDEKGSRVRCPSPASL